MIEQWQPDTVTPDALNTDQVKSVIASTAISVPGQLPDIDNSCRETMASYIKSSDEAWSALLTSLSNDEILALAYFYTRAEMVWAEFISKDNNPAIRCFQHLKSTKSLPEKALIKQLKSETDNRFIPYGSVL